MQIINQMISSESTNSDADRRLRKFARNLAELHGVELSRNKKTDLLKWLQSWEQALSNAKAVFTAIPSQNPAFTRAGEWMLDNFYIVKQTFRQIEVALPASFLSQLPKLAETAPIGSSAPKPAGETSSTVTESGIPLASPTESLGTLPVPGLPRIFVLAWEWIGYTQSQLDLDQVAAFVQEYQQIIPLLIGELWALPIMLRIGILEQLVNATSELIGMESKPRSTIRTTFPSSSSGNNLPNNGYPRLVHNLELPGETQRQLPSTAQEYEGVVANCFRSLRLLSATDWKDFFEQTSLVEKILRDDPAKIYAKMDFDTRNSYRSVIEELARHSAFSEEEIAHMAIEFANKAQDNFLTGLQKSDRKAHVGYYLRDEGVATLEASLHYQPDLSVRFKRALLASPTFLYLGSIAIISTLFLLGLVVYTNISGGSAVQDLIAGLLGFGLALEAAISLVNWNVTHHIQPQSLPRMDYSEGIAPGNRTMVVIPTLLESAGELAHLLQELELYSISNPDPQLTYALLTDFGDAPTEHMPQDESLLALASAGINNLNSKYARSAPYYLFHRHRQWNPSEGVWMGWERKRGKLADFNHLLLGQGETAYTTQVGDISILPEIKYVITLDADTSLPQGSANRLVATLAHPLNHAEFAPDGRSVIAGYTVLQPRVAIKPTSAKSLILFENLFREYRV